MEIDNTIQLSAEDVTNLVQYGFVEKNNVRLSMRSQDQTELRGDLEF